MAPPEGPPGPERPSEREAGPERPSEREAGPERPSEREAGPERPSEREAGPVGDFNRNPTDPRIGRVVVSRHQIEARVTELGRQITLDYRDRPRLLLVGVLKGAFVFMSDLARAIDTAVEVDFMAVSSYGSATKSSGVVRIVKDLDADLRGRHVLLVEDIVDSGLTLSYVRKNLSARAPASLEACALLVRQGLQKHDPELRYVGFDIPPEFVIGYGLDVDEAYRNLRDVCVYEESGAP